MPDIVIKDLKNIQLLEFDIPRRGGHVLSGSNGCGKTSLLTCLERLKNSFAFSRHFRTSGHNQFDSFKKAEIIYSNLGNSVTYKYSNTRWAPNPRKNATVLNSFGFASVLFLPSTGERFYIQEQELNTRNIQAAEPFFKDSMKEIFQSQKFDDLRRIKLTGRGRGDNRRNRAFVLPAVASGGPRMYYSEKNFSLGEILVLNALYALNNVPSNSLVLIDEIELALHPRVQVKFLKFLERIANNKQLSILISTHSASLIKAAPRLIHIEKNIVTGAIEVNYNCYPALALQNVAIEEEVQPDIVFFTEDATGKHLLAAYIDRYFNIVGGRIPIIKILPVGGWKETMKFLVASRTYLIPRNTKSFCYLDLDAHTDLTAIQGNAGRSISQTNLLNIYNTNLQWVKFFDITPEQGIIDMLYGNPLHYVQLLQQFFAQGFDISQIIIDEQNRGINYPPNLRSAAKKRLEYILQEIANSTGKDENQTLIALIQFYVVQSTAGNGAQIRARFGPVFN